MHILVRPLLGLSMVKRQLTTHLHAVYTVYFSELDLLFHSVSGLYLRVSDFSRIYCSSSAKIHQYVS